MNSQKCNILLIIQREEAQKTRLYEFLTGRGYDVYQTNKSSEGIYKAGECSPDIIICQNEVDDKTGLQIYNTLHRDLSQKGIAFFLYLKEYCKEDVLIGLEMGVDNFLFMPFDKKALTRKIENQLDKTKKSRILDSDNFRLQFESTPVAKFVAKGNRLIMINQALKELIGLFNNEIENLTIEKLFDVTAKDNEYIDYRKCMSGLKNFCLLQSVALKTNSWQRLNIYLVRADYLEEELFMAEVVPSGEPNEGLKHSVNGTEISELLNSNGFHLTAREQEVLQWSSQGLPIKQIASILHISERTVEKHRANIMAKTETSSIVEAIYAIRRKNN
jgi:two-component system alkaline phosphatase synthesis response regulator PhoP